MSKLNQTLPVTILGLVVNVALAFVKFAAGIAGNSQALIADGAESLADLISSMIVWRGLVVAALPPDEDHPYGHGKAEPIASATVAGILLLVAAGIGWDAAKGLFQPHELPRPFTLWVLVGVVVIKEAMFRVAARQARLSGSPAVQTDAWHHRSDAITSLAATVGISVAIMGGPAFAAADGLAAMVAAFIIAWNGWKLLRPALHDLMDSSPNSEMVAEVERLAEQVPGVEAVEKCLIRKSGYHFLVDMHVEVDPEMSVRRSHEIAHQVKDRLRERIPSIRDVLIHIEPSRRTGGN